MAGAIADTAKCYAADLEPSGRKRRQTSFSTPDGDDEEQDNTEAADFEVSCDTPACHHDF